MKLFLVWVTVLVLVAFISAESSGADSPGGKRVLAVLQDATLRGTHSMFFKALEERGYNVDYHTHDERVPLQKYGEWNYDHLILFAPAAHDFAGNSVSRVLEFIDAGHNVIVAGRNDLEDSVHAVASDCNVEYDEAGSFVIDHFNFDVSDFDGKHTLLVADGILDNRVIFPTKVEAPVLFEGIGQDIEEDSALLFPVLTAAATAYSHSPETAVKSLHVAGGKTVLVSALQARNNARVIFSGSLSLFSDKLFNSPAQKYSADGKGKKYDKSGNEQFSKQLVQWAFQERGILRAINVKHHKVGETEAPFTYTVNDTIEYSITIEEWNNKKWVPFTANDVQLEFKMLDPYIRTRLTSTENGNYHTVFIAPDVYGVFTFKVEYARKGYGFLTSITRSPVRPYRHNEYERWIPSAYPYYASAFSMMGGLFLFSWLFLFHAEPRK